MSRTSPKGPDAERVIRELAQSGNDIIFTTSFGYMNPTEKVAKQFPKVKFAHATGYKTGPNMANYNARFYEGRYLTGVIAGKMTEDQRAGICRRVSDSRGAAGDQCVRARRASVNPEGRVRVIWVNSVVRPGQGARGGADASVAERGHRHASHRLDRRRPGGRGKRQVRIRLSLRHVEVRPEGAPDRDDAPVGRLLHQGRAIGSGRRLEADVDLGRLQGRDDQASRRSTPPFPPTSKDQIAKLEGELKAGTFHPFAGPVKDQDGKERIATWQDDERRRARQNGLLRRRRGEQAAEEVAR
jgi:simple sugar transport system substrate-binding protein